MSFSKSVPSVFWYAPPGILAGLPALHPVAPFQTLFAGHLPCTRLPLPGHFSQGSRPATRRPLLKKGSIRKLFLRAGNMLFMEGQRTRNAGAVNFRRSIYGHRVPPLPGHFSQGAALHPATPFEKGVDPKTFLRMGNILFMERHRIRNAGTVDFWAPVYGCRSLPLF